jgi:uncharacterized protein YqeY
MTTIKEQLDKDLKTAMLAGEKQATTTLRGLKSAILYAEVAKGVRDTGLAEQDVIGVLSKESKQRQESAELYVQGGNQAQADAELAEKVIIDRYLPKQLTDEELISLIDKVMTELNINGPQAMGQIIGVIKQKTAGRADGSRIATLVKERLK